MLKMKMKYDIDEKEETDREKNVCFEVRRSHKYNIQTTLERNLTGVCEYYLVYLSRFDNLRDRRLSSRKGRR